MLLFGILLMDAILLSIFKMIFSSLITFASYWPVYPLAGLKASIPRSTTYAVPLDPECIHLGRPAWYLRGYSLCECGWSSVPNGLAHNALGRKP